MPIETQLNPLWLLPFESDQVQGKTALNRQVTAYTKPEAVASWKSLPAFLATHPEAPLSF